MDGELRRLIAEESLRLAPQLSSFFRALDLDAAGVVARAFPVEDPLLRAPRPGRTRGVGDPADPPIGGTVARSPVTGVPIFEADPFAAGRSALEKLERSGVGAMLSDEELQDLHTILVVAVRPAILFHEGHFLPPPPQWEFLEESRTAIDSVAMSVGRIKRSGAPPEESNFAGTGFIVGPGVMVTNAHVVEDFGDVVNGAFTFTPGMASGVDLGRRPDEVPGIQLSFSRVEVHPSLDMAVLEVESEFPVPELRISADPPPPPTPEEPHHVYVVGYPGRDGNQASEVVERILGQIVGAKRLQPGQIMEIFDDRAQFDHDCSTLQGNSGSCVVDLATNRVLGLHFGSHPKTKRRKAVALWRLADDPLLKSANFA